MIEVGLKFAQNIPSLRLWRIHFGTLSSSNSLVGRLCKRGRIERKSLANHNQLWTSLHTKRINQPAWNIEEKKNRPSEALNSSTSTLSNMYPENPHDPSTTDPQSLLFVACPLMHASSVPAPQKSQTPEFAAQTTTFAPARDKHVAAIQRTRGD